MAKNNVIELAGRDTIVDPLTDLLRAGAEKLIYQAVEAELQEQLVRSPYRGRACRCCTQWFSAGT